MLIRQRKIRRSSKFRPKWQRGARRGKDYVLSVAATAIVEALLFVFLLVGAYRSFVVMRNRMPDLGSYIRYGVPLGMVAIAVLVLKLLLDSVRQIAETRRNPPSGE